LYTAPSSEQDPRSDEELLACLAEGDPSALDSLLERYWSPLVQFVNRSAESADAASDIVQDVFCRLWERRQSWSADGSPRGLLYRLACNSAASARRRVRARDRVHRTFLQFRPPIVMPVAAESAELRDQLESAIAALPPRRREVFLLRVLHGLSYKEIAEIMGTSCQTVANQLSHALGTLRHNLGHLLD
jgi:RNA polymerase sigma-70 factor (ECF subfamily)